MQEQKQQFVSLVENRRLRIAAFLFLLMAMFLATLDNQIVPTSLPTIVGDFGQMERFGWVASAYLLATCAVMPIYGKLGDLIDRKYVLMTAITIFLVGSLTCGLAVSMNTLIAAYEKVFASVFFFAAVTAGLGLVAALVIKLSELGYAGHDTPEPAKKHA